MTFFKKHHKTWPRLNFDRSPTLTNDVFFEAIMSDVSHDIAVVLRDDVRVVISVMKNGDIFSRYVGDRWRVDFQNFACYFSTENAEHYDTWIYHKKGLTKAYFL